MRLRIVLIGRGLDEDVPIVLAVVNIMTHFCNQRTVVALNLPIRLGVVHRWAHHLGAH